MSWINSLNTLKGQLTTFAQEVLSEGDQEEEINPLQALEESQRKNEELNVLCVSKDNEIAALRRQIAEFQSKHGESGRSSKLSLEKNASLEDSWIWEPENPPSDSSVKNDSEGNSESSSGGEMITIPLDAATNASGSYEKIPKNTEYREQKLKKLMQENASLSEKVAELTECNKSLNLNLEELDSQNSAAIQKLLDLKTELQDNFNKLSDDYEKLQKEHETEVVGYKNDFKKLQEHLFEVKTLNNTYLTENKDLKSKLETLQDYSKQQQSENITMKTNLAIKEKHLLELIEKIENWEVLYQQDKEALNNFQEENMKLKKILEELGVDLDELTEGKELKHVLIKKHKDEDGFIVLEDEGDDFDGISWKQKYNELLSKYNELQLNDIVEIREGTGSNIELESQLEILRKRIVVLEEENNNYLDRLTDLQNSLLLKNKTSENENIELSFKKKFEDIAVQREKEISTLKAQIEDLEYKIVLLEKEKSVLQADNEMCLGRIEKLKNATSIDLEHYEELNERNQVLQDNFNAADCEFMDYQEEQTRLRTKLEAKIKQLTNKVSELENLQHEKANEDIIADLRHKISSIEEEKSVLEIDNKSYLENIEKLKILASKPCQYPEFVSEEEIEKSDAKTQGAYKALPKESDKLFKVLEDKIEALETQNYKLNDTNKKLEMELEEYKKFEKQGVELQQMLTELYNCNEKYKTDIERLKDKVEKCEANASDVESKLMMENVDLQKRIIDMESSINQNQTETQMNKNNQFYTFDEIKNLFALYLQADLTANDKNSVEIILKSIRDKIWKIDILERNLKQMSDEISRLLAEKSALDHEKNTLQADILNYEIECGELMKNNEILINELENYKRNKLETIHENNEDSIVILEKQLEDCNNLNRTLEDEYKDLNLRIEEMENDKKEHILQIQSLQDINSNLNQNANDLKLQLEALEAERCNLIFEINEMKTDDKKSAVDVEIQEYRSKVFSLEAQLERLSRDHADLVATMQSQKNTIVEYKRESEELKSKLEKALKDKNTCLSVSESDIKKLHTEIESLRSSLQDKALFEDKYNDLNLIFKQLQGDHESLKMKLESVISEKYDLEEKVKEIEQKCSISTCDHDHVIQSLNAEIDKLKQNSLNSEEYCNLKKQFETVNNEKAELVQAVTMKHNENLQYYMEIQRLGKLLQLEIEKSQVSNCEKCITLQNEIANITNANGTETEKLKDQINFLMEKSDILTTNLLTEQTNQKLLQQEKSELAEQNNNLKKDLERLREHLVELEEAHTQESLEMQKLIDDTKAKMRVLEDEAANSSTAYTSASIRANQHAETLQAQYQLISQQRDELAAKLSVAEDRESKNQAALVNLQCALEQFQKEKEKDIRTETYRIRNELQSELEKHKKLQNEIAALNHQLADANQGLLAASRLSNQLEASQVTISALKEEIAKLQSKNQALDEKLRITESSHADKIEKSLIKSLIIGYIVSNNPNDKSQILKVITTVLSFDQAETDKIGVNKNQTGWFGGLLHVGSTVSHGTDSLARAFVNFLEQESRPQNDSSTMPNLLNIVSENPSDTASTSTNNNQRKLSESRTNQSAVQPILLDESVLDQFAPTRNSSSILKDILSDS